MRGLHLAIAAVACVCAPIQARAQDANVDFPVDSIEQWLGYQSLEVVASSGSRFEHDRTLRVTLRLPNALGFPVKWAKAPPFGEEFNNAPRYELAAYELQKLFLAEPDYVVPPTVIRAFPLEWCRRFDREAEPTFRGTHSVVVVLQYWLRDVTFDGWWDEDRFRQDVRYAWHLANMNILTHLIDHKDSNLGNFLVSQDSANPRAFTVDNGLSFESPTSDRGTEWGDIRVDRLPQATVERLRQVTQQDLEAALGVLVQFEIHDGMLVRVEPTENLDPGKGVRRKDDVIQFGLTEREIRNLYRRVEKLLEGVDEGKYELFSRP